MGSLHDRLAQCEMDILIHKPGADCWWPPLQGMGYCTERNHRPSAQRQTSAERPRRCQGKELLADCGDHVAVVGENRKVLVFSIEELPEMNRVKACGCKNIKMVACQTLPPLI